MAANKRKKPTDNVDESSQILPQDDEYSVTLRVGPEMKTILASRFDLMRSTTYFRKCLSSLWDNPEYNGLLPDEDFETVKIFCQIISYDFDINQAPKYSGKAMGSLSLLEDKWQCARVRKVIGYRLAEARKSLSAKDVQKPEDFRGWIIAVFQQQDPKLFREFTGRLICAQTITETDLLGETAVTFDGPMTDEDVVWESLKVIGEKINDLVPYVRLRCQQAIAAFCFRRSSVVRLMMSLFANPGKTDVKGSILEAIQTTRDLWKGSAYRALPRRLDEIFNDLSDGKFGLCLACYNKKGAHIDTDFELHEEEYVPQLKIPQKPGNKINWEAWQRAASSLKASQTIELRKAGTDLDEILINYGFALQEFENMYSVLVETFTALEVQLDFTHSTLDTHFISPYEIEHGADKDG